MHTASDIPQISPSRMFAMRLVDGCIRVLSVGRRWVAPAVVRVTHCFHSIRIVHVTIAHALGPPYPFITGTGVRVGHDDGHDPEIASMDRHARMCVMREEGLCIPSRSPSRTRACPALSCGESGAMMVRWSLDRDHVRAEVQYGFIQFHSPSSCELLTS